MVDSFCGIGGAVNAADILCFLMIVRRCRVSGPTESVRIVSRLGKGGLHAD